MILPRAAARAALERVRALLPDFVRHVEASSDGPVRGLRVERLRLDHAPGTPGRIGIGWSARGERGTYQVDPAMFERLFPGSGNALDVLFAAMPDRAPFRVAAHPDILTAHDADGRLIAAPGWDRNPARPGHVPAPGWEDAWPRLRDPMRAFAATLAEGQRSVVRAPEEGSSAHERLDAAHGRPGLDPAFTDIPDAMASGHAIDPRSAVAIERQAGFALLVPTGDPDLLVAAVPCAPSPDGA